MTSTFCRTVAALAAAAALSVPLTGCGSTPSSVYIPPPTTYCVGPEKINDLGDLLHREMVRYPDAYCASGALPQGFAIVSAPDYVSVPDIGEDVLVDPYWGYARSHRYVSHTVVHVINPVSPPRTSVLLVRDPTVGSSQARAAAASAAQQARKAGVSGTPSGTTAGPSGSSTVQRGGLGSSTASAGSVRQVDSAAIQKASAGKATSTSKGSMSGGSKSGSSTSSTSGSSSKPSKTGK